MPHPNVPRLQLRDQRTEPWSSISKKSEKRDGTVIWHGEARGMFVMLCQFHQMIKRTSLEFSVIVGIHTLLHYITLHYITLHYITYHYIPLHFIPFHCITSHHITLYYITYILT